MIRYTPFVAILFLTGCGPDPLERLAGDMRDSIKQSWDVAREQAKKEKPIRFELRPPARENDPEAAAVSAVLKFGGRVGWDDEQPNNPIVAVTIDSNPIPTVEDLRVLKSFPQLRSLQITDARLDEKTMEELGTFTTLTGLGLNNCGGVDLAALRPLANLRSLDLYRSTLADTGLKPLTEMKGLTTLLITVSEFRDDEMKDLGTLEQLTSLTLVWFQRDESELRNLAGLSRLMTLKLRDSGVTDAGLKELVPLQALREISLVGTKVTDEGLKCLAAMPNLATIDLTGTRVTDRGRQLLKGALPNCRIVYKLP